LPSKIAPKLAIVPLLRSRLRTYHTMFETNPIEGLSLLSKRFGKETAPNFFSANPLNRFSFLRTDKAFLKSTLYHPNTQFLTLQNLNPPVLRDTGKLCYLKHDDVKDVIGDKRYDNDFDDKDEAILIFLGIDETFRNEESKGDAYFALDITNRQDIINRVQEAGAKYESVPLGRLLNREDAGIVALARSMIDWNARNQFCPTCGCQTVTAWGGYKRRCLPNDPTVTANAQLPEPQKPQCINKDGRHNFEYPRTDMSVIMAVLSKDGTKVLLGRQRKWPPGFYSCLAGFVEPGESVEEAVRREVWEESGVRVGRVIYHSSQPWPFPAQLMIGCIAHSLNDTIDLKNDPELEHARFFDKADLCDALENRAYMRADPALNAIPDDALKLPPKTAIAHSILKSIAEDDWGLSKM